MGDDVTIDK